MKSTNSSAGTARRASHAGFTLIELLIVIAIIAILASILFPVFARARESGKRASCLSNVRQLGMGVQQYTQDYDERVVPFATSSNCPCWPDKLFPYVKSAQVFSACPSKKGAVWVPNAKSGMAYAYNVLYNAAGTADGQETTPPSGTGSANGLALAQAAVPAETVMFGDSSDQYIVFSSSKTDIATELSYPVTHPTGLLNIGREATSTTNTNQHYVGRHFDGSNFAFMDGHAKWLPMTEVGKKNSHGVMYYFTVEDDKTW